MRKLKGKVMYSPLSVKETQGASDGSVNYNVVFAVEGRNVRLACEDEAAADSLKNALNHCAWVELF